jgi:hypothetical protein
LPSSMGITRSMRSRGFVSAGQRTMRGPRRARLHSGRGSSSSRTIRPLPTSKSPTGFPSRQTRSGPGASPRIIEASSPAPTTSRSSSGSGASMRPMKPLYPRSSAWR